MVEDKSMKYLYVCTSSKKDFFLEQTFVSITTLKINTPNAFVTLLIDKATEKTLDESRENIKKIVDEIIIIDLDESLSAKVRSRLLKTSMRLHIQGDFLFIDNTNKSYFQKFCRRFRLSHNTLQQPAITV